MLKTLYPHCILIAADAGFRIAADWGFLPLAFGAGLLWQHPSPALHLYCPGADSVEAGPSPEGVHWTLVAAAFVAGAALASAAFVGFAVAPRIRRVRALFDA